MIASFPRLGKRVVAKVIETDGECTIGMKQGDEFELSIHRCGDFCGYFYHNIFNWISTLQFGGSFPMGSHRQVETCHWCEPRRKVRVELKRTEWT